MIHKIVQEGHPTVVKEAQQHVNWIDSLGRGVNGEGLRGMLTHAMINPWSGSFKDKKLNSTGYGPLIREYVFFLLAKLAFHRQHPEFNGKHLRWVCLLQF